ncbi:MAG: hypothetical protein ACF8AM_10025, partial [Rhodopirellula sp. JB055]|uniref:hypothetical protein n=1 Tax=Rhodopirellula sp. JB055 TaxID=3342846 RepID=UPI00370ABE0D
MKCSLPPSGGLEVFWFLIGFVTADPVPHSSIRAQAAQVGWLRVGETPHLRTSDLLFKQPSGR